MTDATKDPTRAPGDTGGERPRGMCVRAAELSAVREESREADFICSTDSLDSYGEIVRQNWILTRFASNPVALWSHDSHSLPVGQWRNVRVEDGALRGTFIAATAAANPHAEHVWQSMLQRTIRAVSVGFMPRKVTYEEIEGKEGSFCVLDENELFEISPTPLPANPEALVDIKRRALEEFRAKRGLAPPPPPGICHTLGAVEYEAFAVTDSAWNASAVVRRLRAWASDGKGADHIDWNKYRRAFAHVDQTKTHEFRGYKFPHHDVKDGKLTTPKGGVVAACAAFERVGARVAESDRAGVKSHLQREAHLIGVKAPWEAKSTHGGTDTLTNITGAAGSGQKGSKTVGTKKKDGETEESAKAATATVTCPECGAEFDPEDDGDGDEEKSKHAKAFRARLGELVIVRSAPIVAERDTLKSSVADITAKHAKAMSDLALAQKANDDLSLRLVDADLLPLSGVKYAPAAHQGQVDLAKHYLSQGDAGAAKWKAHLDGLRGGPDLKILGAPIVPADPTPSSVAKSADLSDMLTESLAAS